MKRFLTLKHWQLFTLLFGLPFILQFVVIGAMFANDDAMVMIYTVPIMMILFIAIFFGWFYALGTNLHKKLPPTAPMNLTRFKVFLFIPVVYILLFSVFMIRMFSSPLNEGQPEPAMFAIIIPMHLFSMFCIFYCLYFNAKALKTVEWQRPVTFSDFAGEFCLLWVYPIGIWILQPRINKLFDETAAEKVTTQ